MPLWWLCCVVSRKIKLLICSSHSIRVPLIGETKWSLKIINVRERESVAARPSDLMSWYQNISNYTEPKEATWKKRENWAQRIGAVTQLTEIRNKTKKLKRLSALARERRDANGRTLSDRTPRLRVASASEKKNSNLSCFHVHFQSHKPSVA